MSQYLIGPVLNEKPNIPLKFFCPFLALSQLIPLYSVDVELSGVKVTDAEMSAETMELKRKYPPPW
jgi:hypothetical protein